MLALVVTVPASEAELASDALWALGVAAIEERRPTATADRREDHFVELWTSLGDDVDAVTRAAEAFPKRWRWRTVELDAAVAESWRAHAVPSWVDADLVVVPAWQDVPTPPAVLRVDIDPGAAFGLGDHPTTVLSLRLLREVQWPGASVLDVGLRQRRARHRRRAARRAVRRGDRHLAGRRRRRRMPTPVATASPASSPPAPRRWRRSTSSSTSCWPTCWPPSSSTSPPTCGACRRPAARSSSAACSTASHEHVVEALAPMRVVDDDGPGGLGGPPAAPLISWRAGPRSSAAVGIDGTAPRRVVASAPAAAARPHGEVERVAGGEAGGEGAAERVAGAGRVDRLDGERRDVPLLVVGDDAHAGARRGW